MIDVIRSSGGTPAAEQADFLTSGFPDVLSGLLCARRIQWAIEGFIESVPFKNAAAAILVDCSDGPVNATMPSSRDLASSLEGDGSAKGQILVSLRACESVEGLPGVTLEEVSGKNLRRWSMKPQPGPLAFGSDEQAILAMIRAAGRVDPLLASGTHLQPPPPALPAQDTSYNPPSTTRTFAAPASEETVAPRKLPLIPILIGSAAVLLIGIALLFVFNRKSPVQSAAPAPAVVPVQGAPANSAAPASSVRPARSEPRPKPPSLLDRLTSKKPAKAESPAVPAPVESHCDLTAEDIQRSLERADRYTHGGDLSNAKAAYLHVLGCPAAREKAQEGLVRIQRMAAQNGAPGP